MVPSEKQKSLAGRSGYIHALWLVLPLMLSAWSPLNNEDAVGAFKSWFNKYQKGLIELYQPSKIPLPSDKNGSYRYFKKENVQEMDALLGALVTRNDLQATKQLAEAAGFYFDRRPDVEVEKHFRKQPWILRAHALESLQQITDPASLDWLGDRCMRSRSGWDAPFRRIITAAVFGSGTRDNNALLLLLLRDPEPMVRITAIESLGRVGGPVELEAILELTADPEPSVRVAAVESLGRLAARDSGKWLSLMESCLNKLAKHLEDPEWSVQEAILGLLERFRSVQSIPILIEFLEKSHAPARSSRERILQRTVEVLRSLTGTPLTSLDPEPWKRWWSANEETFKLSPAPPKYLKGLQTDSPTFFNIPLNSDSVYFILDISGSMKNPLEASGSLTAETKLDRARQELSNTLAALDETVRFNIVLFNTELHLFSEKALSASQRTKEKARDFFETVEAEGDTNLFDALNLALKIRNMGLVDHLDGQDQLDTVFLLSDGVPTKGVVIDPAEILRIVTQANRLSKIKINTIFLGSEPSQFMRNMAEENSGRYIQIK